MTTTGDKLTKILLVVGPTASGKTGLSLRLAEALGGELVNADSVQVYRRFDIGSCKATPEERARAPHHLLDALEPDDPCDAGRFVTMADDAIRDIAARGRLPIVVGGTGLYFRALVHGLAELPPVPDAVRAAVQAELERDGVEALWNRLRQVDPTAAQRIQPRDKQRITRALEVFDATGRPLSEVQAAHGFQQRRYDARALAIDWPREELYARINRRVDEMMAAGFLDEVRGLLADGLDRDLRPMQSLGYREAVAHLIDGVPLAQTVEDIKRGHRRYAKRQITWFRRVPDVRWLAPDEADAASPALLAQ